MSEQMEHAAEAEKGKRISLVHDGSGGIDIQNMEDFSFAEWATLKYHAEKIMASVCHPGAFEQGRRYWVTFILNHDGTVDRDPDSSTITENEWAIIIWTADAIMQRNLYKEMAVAEQKQQAQQVQQARFTQADRMNGIRGY